MRLAVFAALAVCGCNQFFDLERTIASDAGEPPVIRCFGDEFEDGELDLTRWTYIGDPAGPPLMLEQNGELQAPIAAGQVGYNGLLSVPFDMVDGTLSARIDPAYVAGWTDTEFVLDASALAKYIITMGGAVINIHYVVNNLGGPKFQDSYSAQYRYVRFRHEAAAKMMHLETSSDGEFWTVRNSGPEPYMPVAAQATVLVGSYEQNMTRVPADSMAIYDMIRHRAPSCTP